MFWQDSALQTVVIAEFFRTIYLQQTVLGNKIFKTRMSLKIEVWKIPQIKKADVTYTGFFRVVKWVRILLHAPAYLSVLFRLLHQNRAWW